MTQWHSSATGLQLNHLADQNKPLSELFKPEPNSWGCEACYVTNKGSDTICVSCTTPKPGTKVETSVTETPKSNFGFESVQPFSFKTPISSTGFTFGSVEPKTSTESNTIFSNTNFKFGNTGTQPSNTVFGPLVSTPPQFGFQIDKTKDTKSPQNMFSLNPNPNDSKLNSFQFGLSRTFDFEFPKFGAQEAVKPPESSIEDTPQHPNDEENTSFGESQVEPSNADSIYFQPVVPLPPKIEVKTGEEEENVLHTFRARLFRFCDNEWKERGVGEIKILESRDSNRIRLLMRRDTIFKVCLNQSITKDLKLDLKDDKKSITWSAIDYSEDTPIPQIFLLRLKNADIAQQFLRAVESTKSLLVSEVCPQSVTDINEKEKNKMNEISKKSSAKPSEEDDIQIVYQKMPESRDILEKVQRLKLPLNFYDYENMPPCPGCRGCQDTEMPIFAKSKLISPERITNDSPDSTQESIIFD